LLSQRQRPSWQRFFPSLQRFFPSLRAKRGNPSTHAEAFAKKYTLGTQTWTAALRSQ
jgi:hypothetical protein